MTQPDDWQPSFNHHPLVDDDISVQNWLNTDAQPRRIWFEGHYARFVQLRHADRQHVGWLRHSLTTAVQSFGVLAAGYFGPMEIRHAWVITFSIWFVRLVDLGLQIVPSLRKSAHFDEIDTAMTRVAELLRETQPVTHSDRQRQNTRNQHSIAALLSLIEAHVRHLVNVPTGKITVTFARYTDSSRKLDIALRNRGSLRAMKHINADNFILGHRVCQTTTEVRTVHDLRHFPDTYRRSPTGNEAKYLSFMIFPVRERHPADGPCVGFLSIDCEIPYAFYGKRAKLIVATVGPILNQISQRLPPPEDNT